MKDASPMRLYSVLRGYFHPNAGEHQFMGNSLENVGQISNLSYIIPFSSERW